MIKLLFFYNEKSCDVRLCFSIEKRWLEVVGTQALAGGLSSEAAWNMIISDSVIPTVEVNFTVEDCLATLHTEWYRLAQEFNFFDEQNTFLISLSDQDSVDLPWSIVRCALGTRFADYLPPCPGRPEFVTSSLDGSVILGVTAEERSMWIIREQLKLA